MTIGAVARLAGVSVRTLHHYDAIGLLSPSTRTESGYRTYDDADLDRLQQILYFRELDLPLRDIASILDDPGFDRIAALRLQRRTIDERIERLIQLAAALDTAIAAEERGEPMKPEDMLEIFGDFDPSEHEAEAEERWGETPAYRESARRTAGYGTAEWQEIATEAAAITGRFVELLDAGIDPQDGRALEAADRHRAHITRWFYECSPEIHAGLADLYVSDPRFTAGIDRERPGLAAYMAAAIKANASTPHLPDSPGSGPH